MLVYGIYQGAVLVHVFELQPFGWFSELWVLLPVDTAYFEWHMAQSIPVQYPYLKVPVTTPHKPRWVSVLGIPPKKKQKGLAGGWKRAKELGYPNLLPKKVLRS